MTTAHAICFIVGFLSGSMAMMLVATRALRRAKYRAMVAKLPKK